jgi:hypothetical protein
MIGKDLTEIAETDIALAAATPLSGSSLVPMLVGGLVLIVIG